MAHPCAVALGFLLQLQPTPGLDEILQSNRRMRVSRAVANEAVTRLRDGSAEIEDIARLAKVAKTGRAVPGLAAALAQLIADDGSPEKAEAATLELAKLDLKVRKKAIHQSAAWDARLQDLAESEDDAVADAAVVLLAPSASPELVVDLVTSWASREGTDRRACALLARVDELHGPGKVFEGLADLEVESKPLEQALLEALPKLVARSPAAAKAALAQAEMGQWGSRAVVMRSLGSVKTLRHWKQASPLVRDEVMHGIGALEDGEADEELLAAALRSSGELLLDEVLPESKSLAQYSRSITVRKAALWAFGRLTYKDAPSIDLLIGLLDDPVVGVDAYHALRYKSGVNLSLRPQAWKAWRATQTLPLRPPEDAEERLTRDRKARFKPAKKRVAKKRSKKRKRSKRKKRSRSS